MKAYMLLSDGEFATKQLGKPGRAGQTGYWGNKGYEIAEKRLHARGA